MVWCRSNAATEPENIDRGAKPDIENAHSRTVKMLTTAQAVYALLCLAAEVTELAPKCSQLKACVLVMARLHCVPYI